MARVACAAPLLLGACAAPAPEAGALAPPPEVLAALPPDLGPEALRRRADGCWFILLEDDLSGMLRPVKDESGKVICEGDDEA